VDRASSQPSSASRNAHKPVSIWLVPVLALLIALSLMMTGCELVPLISQPETPTVEVEPTPGIETAEEDQATPLPPGVTLLVFWEPFSLDRPQGILLGEMIRDFEAENPDILVELVAKNGYLGIHDAMLTELPNGELPDMAVAFPSMIAEYAAQGVVAPLDRYIYDPDLGLNEEDLADIYAAHLTAGRLPGFGAQILAFPFAQNAIGMWVNDSLLAQAGWDRAPATWPEFEQACWDVAAASGVNCYPFVESVTTFTAWLYSRGGQPLDESGQQATFGGPAGVESLALLRRLMDAGLAWRPEEPYGDYKAFANGQAAFTFSSTGNGNLYAGAYEGALHNGVAPFHWRQTLIPQADPQQPATALYGSSFFVLSGDLATEQAAWRLIRWFTDTNQTARWATELEGLPVRASALEVMTDTLAAYPFVRAQVEEILPYGRPEPSVPEALQMRDILYTAILSVTLDYVDPQLALEQAVRDVNKILSGQE
jgi:multiple sugar transport system substrate-binding protein